MARAVAHEDLSGIPDKLYFRIGEVSQLVGVEPYVLRYWETEFSSISPKKSGTGHRLYRRKDVETVLRIKHLLYDQRYTIEGARQLLEHSPKTSASKRAAKGAAQASQGELFREDPLPAIRKELKEILDIIH